MSDIELKPCPFCGCEAIYPDAYEPRPGVVRWRVVCTRCMAQVRTSAHRTAWDAAKAWNRRVGEEGGER